MARTLQNLLIFAIIFVSFPNEVPADNNSLWPPIRTTNLRRISPISAAPSQEDGSQASVAITPTVPNTDFSQFVRFGKKVLAIAFNYRFNSTVLPRPDEPAIAMKPTTAYITEGQRIELPESLGSISHEIELGIVIGKRGKNIPESQVLDYVAGYFLALDMTAMQYIIENGNNTVFPWSIAKGFDTALPVGDFIPKSLVPDPNNLHLECRVNGELRQSENTSKMLRNVQQIISFVSRYMTLEPFDTILTGTPDGVGPVRGGDVIQGRIRGLTSFEFEAVSIPA